MLGRNPIFKVSEEGTDVRFAADHQLSASSEWVVLPVAKAGWYDKELDDGETDVIVQHNLGYYPFFITGREQPGEGMRIDVGFAPYTADIDKNRLHVTQSNETEFTGKRVQLFYYIFEIDLESAYQSLILNPQESSAPPSNDFIAQSSAVGRSIRDSSVNDLGLNSQARPITIQNISNRTVNPDPVQTAVFIFFIQHGLPYHPTAFLYRKLNNRYRPTQEWFSGQIRPFGLGSLEVTAFAGDNTEATFAVVILKDPFISGEVVRRTS